MDTHSNATLRVAASDALLQRGCVNVIILSEIQAEIGPRWEKNKAAVWAKMDALLRQKLSPTDFYTQIDDLSFLVSMPAADADESRIFCLRIAYELHSSLLGKCEVDLVRFSAATSWQADILALTPVAGEVLTRLAHSAGLGPGGLDEPELPAKRGVARRTPAAIQHKFAPVWDAQQDAVTTYRCISFPEQNVADNANPDVATQFALTVTISRIVASTKMLGKHLEAGERFLMWVPIAYEVLSSASGRMQIATICRSLLSELRPYLIFEVVNLPQGVPQSRLAELVGSLRPFCRGVAAQLPPRTVNYDAYLGAGLQAIGLSLLSFGAGSPELNGELATLSAAARKQHLKSFVFDVHNSDLLRLARQLGINLLSSPLIGPMVDVPMPARRLLLRDIPQTASARVIDQYSGIKRVYHPDRVGTG